MMRSSLVAVLMLGSVPLAGARAQGPGVPLGREVQLRLIGGPKVKGELLAISDDSLWVLASTGGGVVGVRRELVEKGWYRRHGFTGTTAFLWGTLVGVISGAALTAACSTVASACESVFVGVSLTGGTIGGLAALSAEPSSKASFVGADPRQLAPLARFPQGRPLGVSWPSVVPPPQPPTP